MKKPDLIDRKAVISLLHYFTDEACSSIVGDVEKLPSVDANPKNRVLTLEELSERTDPVWVETRCCAVGGGRHVKHCGNEACKARIAEATKKPPHKRDGWIARDIIRLGR